MAPLVAPTKVLITAHGAVEAAGEEDEEHYEDPRDKQFGSLTLDAAEKGPRWEDKEKDKEYKNKDLPNPIAIKYHKIPFPAKRKVATKNQMIYEITHYISRWDYSDDLKKCKYQCH